MRKIIFLIILFIFTGCARQLIWKHEKFADSHGVQQEKLCQYKAQNRPMRGFDIGFREAKIYNDCMFEKGYYKTYKRPPVFVADDWVEK